jgi:subtilisin family serine protease
MSMSWPHRLRAALSALFLSMSLVAGAATDTAPPLAVIGPGVLEQYDVAESASFWLVLRERADLSAAASIADWSARGRYVYDSLTRTADRSQSALRAELERRGVAYRSFWILNAIRVTADRATLLALAERSEVGQIVAPKTWRLPQPAPSREPAGIDLIEWNIDRINAPDVWATFGVRGEGIVVANIDGGVQYDHPALVQQYRGSLGGGVYDHNYNWFDPSLVCGNPSVAPCDNNGHGSHTMGTMVGGDTDNQIGVAPGARWIAAKGCEGNSCSDFALMSSGEWLLAPTDLDGQNPRPDLRPHVVNNSWGSDDPSDLFYSAIVDAWNQSGIYSVFSSGNSGPSCGSLGSPGSYASTYSVGAFDRNDRIASYSGRGPSPISRSPKPNIAAPGSGIRSSVPFNAYGVFDGTSMAAPHVSGTVALMMSAAPALVGDNAQITTLLNQSAIDVSDLTCGGTAANNNVWGEGRLDAFEAVERSPRPAFGTLAGTVTDALTQAPLAGATVSAQGPGPRDAVTDEAGAYSMELAAGDYVVTAGVFGYLDGTANASIAAGATTVQDFALEPELSDALSGIVRDGDGQAVRGAMVTVLNTSIPPVTTDASGAYAFGSIPPGSYDVQASAGGCNDTQTQDVTVAGPVSLDFVLPERRTAFGYACRIVPMPYVAAKTVLDLSGDDETAEIVLPFAFRFFGTSYARAFVSTNGFVSFGGESVLAENGPIPSEAAPNGAIYAYWDDLIVDERASVRTQVLGEAPSRAFVIEWRNARRAGTATGRVTVEVMLAESNGGIVTVYRGIGEDAQERGGSATLGIESPAGDEALAFSVDEPTLRDGRFGVAYFAPPP